MNINILINKELKILFKLRLILVLMIMVLLNPSNLFAFDGKGESSNENSKVINVILKHVPPYMLEKPKVSGLDVEIIKTIFSKMGLVPKFNFVPVKRLEMMAENGNGDVFFILKEKYKGCYTSKSYREWHDGIVVLKDLASQIQSPKDIEGRVIGGFPNSLSILGTELGESKTKIKKYVEYVNSNMALTNLLRGRVDAYLGDFWGDQLLPKRIGLYKI